MIVHNLRMLALVSLAACVPNIPDPQAFSSNDVALAEVAADADSAVSAADAATQIDAAGAELGVDTAISDTGSADAGCQNAGQCPTPAVPCLQAACLAGTCTATVAADGALCSDGIDCTVGDACKTGQCKYGTVTCDCLLDSDCAKKEDGNQCNGTMYCNPVVHECKVNPATTVSCPSVDDTACVKNTCQLKTGLCEMTTVKDNMLCDDDDECTLSDVCKAGLCTASASKCQCQSDAECKPQEDANLCNGTLYCDIAAGICKTNPATVIVCPDGDDGQCTKNTCETKSGLCKQTAVVEGSECGDSSACHEKGSCKVGVCIAGADICSCSLDTDCAKVEDGDLCNGTLYCQKSTKKCVVNPNSVKACPAVANGACQANVCDPKTGQCQLQVASAKKQCDADGDPCTAGDFCDKGVCLAGTTVCSCTTTADCKSKEDGDLCNGTLYCDGGSCKVNPTTVIKCSETGDTGCSKNTCNPATPQCAAKLATNNAACSDGDPCTSGDTCQQGACKAGSNLCACKADSDCLDDGNLCNGLPFCDTAAQPAQCKVKPNSEIKCAASTKVCTANACAAATGVCGPAPGTCSDNNPCTIDKCDVATGSCKALPAIDGAPCGDAKVCAAGACIASSETMVLVPAGTTWMGCSTSEFDCAAAEQPQHLITLPAFWLDRFEVSVARYKLCANAGVCTSAPATAPATCNWGNPQRTKHPVNCVSWPAAQAYCAFAGKRLATEAEWEMAARGPCQSADLAACKASTKAFPWGGKPANCGQTVMKDAVTGDGCGSGTTAICGQQSADNSSTGVRDMGGNVSEWVLDTYDPGFYATSGQNNPINSAAGGTKAVRGGHFGSTLSHIRVAHRQGTQATSGNPTIGIRCAKDAK